MAYTIGSLFSGIGGLDLACEKIFNAQTIWHAEIDINCQQILTEHWPHSTQYGDTSKINFEDVPKVDILCGGYPCQPFSRAGKKRGHKDSKNVWPDYLRAIRTIRPKYAILENVANHLAVGFDRVLGDLSEVGYNVEWGVLAAADIGAPHERKRLFAVAYPVSDGHGGSENSSGMGSLGGKNETKTRYPKWSREIAVYRTAEIDWLSYNSAIKKWELITEFPAPQPTDDEGRHTPEFYEWMMGFPPGWTNKVDRLARLKQLGNSVVPQQAYVALLLLLQRIGE